MNGTILASGRARTATAAVIAVVLFAIGIDQGGYPATAIAWGAIAIWAVVAIGILLRIWPGADVPPLGIAAVACFAGLAAFAVVSMAWADDPGRAFTASLLPAAYAGLMALVLLSLPAIRPRTWLIGIAGGAALIAAVALASRLHPGFLGGGGTLTPIGAQGRLSYPIGYWNGLAACVAVGLVLGVWLGAQGRHRACRAVATGLLPVGGLAIFFTSSRGAVAAVALGVTVLFAMGPNRPRVAIVAALGTAATAIAALVADGRYDLIHDLGTSAQRTQGLEVGLITIVLGVAIGGLSWWYDARLGSLSVPRRAHRPIVIGAIVAAVILIVLADPVAKVREFEHDTPNATALPGQRSLFATSGSGRAQFWRAALDAFASHPFGGVGAANYELYWNAHPRAPTVTANAHSFFLEELADLGPLGLLLAVGPFAAAILAVRRGWARATPEMAPALALLATAAVGATIDWTWLIPAAFIPAVVAIGLLTGEGTLASAPRPARDRSGSRFGLGVATILFAWAVVWVAGIVLFASWRLGQSRDAVGSGNLAAAAGDARSAAAVEPFSPDPPIQLALVYAVAGDLTRARAEAQQAIDKAPGDWRGWALAAEIDARRGARAAAFLEHGRAASLTPIALPEIPLPKPR